MSDCERIAQVARQKLANERIAHLFEKIAHFCSCFLQKMSDLLRKKMSEFPTLQILHHAKSLKIINNFFSLHFWVTIKISEALRQAKK